MAARAVRLPRNQLLQAGRCASPSGSVALLKTSFPAGARVRSRVRGSQLFVALQLHAAQLADKPRHQAPERRCYGKQGHKVDAARQMHEPREDKPQRREGQMRQGHQRAAGTGLEDALVDTRKHCSAVVRRCGLEFFYFHNIYAVACSDTSIYIYAATPPALEPCSKHERPGHRETHGGAVLPRHGVGNKPDGSSVLVLGCAVLAVLLRRRGADRRRQRRRHRRRCNVGCRHQIGTSGN